MRVGYQEVKDDKEEEKKRGKVNRSSSFLHFAGQKGGEIWKEKRIEEKRRKTTQ
jgi:hypothetical protein